MKDTDFNIMTIGNLGESLQDYTAPIAKLATSDLFKESMVSAALASNSIAETMRAAAINLPKFEIPESILSTAKAMKKMEDSVLFKPPTPYIDNPTINFDRHIKLFDPKNTPHYRQQEEIKKHIIEGNEQRLRESKEANELKIKEIEDTNTKDKKVYKTIIYGLAIGLFAVIVTIGIYVLEDLSDNKQHLEIMNSNKAEIARQNLVNKDQERRHQEELALIKNELALKNSIITDLLSANKTSKNPVKSKKN